VCKFQKKSALKGKLLSFSNYKQIKKEKKLLLPKMLRRGWLVESSRR